MIFYRLGDDLCLTLIILFPFLQTLRTKILDFLNPLTAQLGMQLMAAVAAVWNSKKPHRSHSKTKVKIKKNTFLFPIFIGNFIFIWALLNSVFGFFGVF